MQQKIIEKMQELDNLLNDFIETEEGVVEGFEDYISIAELKYSIKCKLLNICHTGEETEELMERWMALVKKIDSDD